MFFDQRGNNRIPLPPYRVPKLHPHNYYKTSQAEEMNKQVSFHLLYKMKWVLIHG